jgi:membrane-bound metal-dependent hydrolase YbcI (DUF457 family)
MNGWNHFLAAFVVLFILYASSHSIYEIIVFSLIFGVLIDFDQIIGKLMKKPIHHRRTWLEEPFGLAFVGIPIGVVLSLFKPDYFFMITIPFLLHIVLDYLTIHEVAPLAPISNKTIKIGFFKSFPKPRWYKKHERGISEVYFTFFISTASLYQLLVYYL